MSNTPSPHAIERAMSEALQLRESLRGSDNTDDQLLLDTIDGETDAIALIDRLAEHAIADELLVEMARARAHRIEARAARSRDLILRMLTALELRKCERPLYTASISHHAKPLITDAAAVPAEYQRSSLDMRLIAKALHAGEPVPGVELSNEMPRLTLRTR